MAFSWEEYPYTNFHELNLDWFLKKFKEIFDEWNELYNNLTSWKTETESDLENWKSDTEHNIEDWESGIISDLNDWKDGFETLFNETFSNLSDIKRDAEAARDAAQGYAENAASSASEISTSLDDISNNRNDIDALSNAILKNNTHDYTDDDLLPITIITTGKWQSQSGASRSSIIAIPETCANIDIETTESYGTVIAFLQDSSHIAGETANFSNNYTERIMLNADTKYNYNVYKDCKYIYILRISSNGNVTPELTFNVIKTDSNLNKVNYPADAKAVGDKLDELSSALKTTTYDGGSSLKNQTINTVCRVSYVVVDDAPENVNLSSYYAYLFTVGGNAARCQFLLYSHTASLYYRFYIASQDRWTDWLEVNNNITNLNEYIKIASFDGGTSLKNQTKNTIARVSTVEVDDAPDNIDLSSYYCYLYTVGGNNKQQYLFYSHTSSLYYRFYRYSNDTWSAWREISGTKPELNILCIGNSFNQDTIAYLPPILNEMLPNYSITYCALYTSSATIADHITYYNNNTKYTYANYWTFDSSSWDRRTGSANGLTLVDALNLKKWDIITMQGTTGDTATETDINNMISDARDLMRIVQSNVTYPFAMLWFEWMARPSGSTSIDGVYTRIKNATKTTMESVGFIDYIPIGTAFQNARSNATFDALGAGGNMLYSDEVHMNAGLPALLAAYTFALKIAEISGNKNAGVYGSSFTPTESTCLAINATNGSGGGMTHGTCVGVTDANKRAIQEVANMAIKYPGTLTDTSNFIEN